MPAACRFLVGWMAACSSFLAGPVVGQEPAADAAGSPTPPVVTSRPAVALSRNDAVLLVETRELVPGVAEYSASFDGQTYFFAGADSLARFERDPVAYAPVMAGDSVVAWNDQARLLPGSVDAFSLYGGRIYLFASAAEKQKFDADPGRYASTDVLLQGFSPVSLVDQEVLRRGDAELALIYEGMQVPEVDEAEQEQFSANPARYFPTLRGLDVVTVREGKPERGLARYAAVYKNRLFAFASEANRRVFLESPEEYADIDVALGGNCPVTQAEDGATVKGHYGISSVLRGKRYLFTSEANRQKFERNPSQYLPGS